MPGRRLLLYWVLLWKSRFVMSRAVGITWYWQQYCWYILTLKINTHCVKIYIFLRHKFEKKKKNTTVCWRVIKGIWAFLCRCHFSNASQCINNKTAHLSIRTIWLPITPLLKMELNRWDTAYITITQPLLSWLRHQAIRVLLHVPWAGCCAFFLLWTFWHAMFFWSLG